MICRACFQLLVDVDEIDTRINTQILKNPHDFLVNLAALYDEKKPDIGTLKK